GARSRRGLGTAAVRGRVSSTAPSGAVLDLRVSASPLAQMGPLDVHALYKLRVDVFVAEQDCPYAEIDETDADPGTTHLLARSRRPVPPRARHRSRPRTSEQHRTIRGGP